MAEIGPLAAALAIGLTIALTAVEAAKLFEELMGDDVEPRRMFIEANAKYVSNLDV